jgi:hypothetical protein
MLKRCKLHGMCTSIVVNKNKTLVGFNFDNPGWKYHIVTKNKAFYISLLVGNLWEPCFGCNSRGDVVNLPAMNPGVKEGYCQADKDLCYIDKINLDLLLERITFDQLKALVESHTIYNEEHLSLQAQDSDHDGNVLQIFPGLGYKLLPKPEYSVLTNFQLLKEEKEHHPWAGVDRYEKANALLKEAKEDFSSQDLLGILKEVAQYDGGAKTAVSFVYDVESKTVTYCQNRHFEDCQTLVFERMGHHEK